MQYLLSFIVSFGASVAAYYVCKWLERHLSKPESNDSDN